MARVDCAFYHARSVAAEFCNRMLAARTPPVPWVLPGCMAAGEACRMDQFDAAEFTAKSRET
jgi:hypothetical protein